jgi:hypothetical protein
MLPYVARIKLHIFVNLVNMMGLGVISYDRQLLQLWRYDCFKQSFATLKAYMNIYRGYAQSFELS